MKLRVNAAHEEFLKLLDRFPKESGIKLISGSIVPLKRYVDNIKEGEKVAKAIKQTTGYGNLDVLLQLFRGIVHDNDIKNKLYRDVLVDRGLASRTCNYTMITPKGVELLSDIGAIQH